MAPFQTLLSPQSYCMNATLTADEMTRMLPEIENHFPGDLSCIEQF
jgi:hypothetical protein